MACEKCWRDAGWRVMEMGGSQAERYAELLQERKDNPCEPAMYADLERSNYYGDSNPEPRAFLTKADCEAKHEFITGNAGSGKTTLVRERVNADSSYGIHTASTGVAAVNLDSTTIHSTLGFFDEADLARKYNNGRLHQKIAALHAVGSLGRHVIIDEVSMLNAACLDMIHSSIDLATDGEVGLVLTGDFAQLPPVEGEFAFKAKCWPKHYAPHTTRLDKIWRQDDPKFLDALNAMRRGQKLSADALRSAGATFGFYLDPNFRGTTLMPTNIQADRINNERYAALDAQERTFVSEFKGQFQQEWKDIPKLVNVKVGMRAMITANDTPMFRFANGDMGDVVDVARREDDRTTPTFVIVRLDRTGEEVAVSPITRRHFDKSTRPYKIDGEATFLPLKLAYALTIHKVQGLTLERIQFDVGHWFASSPALCYVACSRVRRAENISIVGAIDKLASRINCHPEVKEWL